MDPSPRATIDHAALRHNLRRVRQAAPHSRIWAVVKANAYGHGVAEATRSLDADGFAVARLQEARRLRELGLCRPILVMGGIYSEQALHQALELDCEIAVHSSFQAELLVRVPTPRRMRIWLKVNTGMNRLGLPPGEAMRWLERLTGCDAVDGAPGLMTHLANADDLSDPFSEVQCRRLRAIPGARFVPLNIGNSAGILGIGAARTDWVRPGIMLYGISPFLGEIAAERNLQPVMTLRSALMAVNHCREGDRIGYGGTFVCPENMPVGVIGIGYGDGYPRHAPGGTPVLVKGRRVPLVGRVSMDTITVDLRGHPDVDIGDEAILWGTGLPAEDIATAAGTIAYELLSGVTERVKREHIHRDRS
jgi:alanine racemase